MLSQTLLVCWALIVILLGFSFFRLSRRRRRPSKLNMKAGNASLQPAPAGLDPQDATTLDCWFNYNGHLWEAHEVLGVPAGASFGEIQKAHQDLVAEMGLSSRALLDYALKSLEKKYG